MHLDDKIAGTLKDFMRNSTKITEGMDDYSELCDVLNVSKMYYDIDLGESGRYRNHRTKKLVLEGEETDDKIILYDSGRKGGLKLSFPFYYGELEYVHAYVELDEGIKEGDIDHELYQFMADIVYTMVGSRNMRSMLTFAETTDAQTGIPNAVFINKQFARITASVPADCYAVLYINLQNFKYINEIGSSRCGDEAIIKYARTLVGFVNKDECVCRMGGDNFALFVRKEHLEEIIEKLRGVTIDHLNSLPERSFEISAWIGISEGEADDKRPFGARLEEASTACGAGKAQLKRNVVVYTDELRGFMNRGREIIALFRPAVHNREFHPFFQAKVDMRTGALVGFEALCRWIHDGRFIYPDQFIPILDKEGLIYDLDMAIFRETCVCIKKWKDEGLNPPRISSNFSRKNLFVPDIEKKIYDTIMDTGISPENVEIEITESVKEHETARLMEFVKILKEYGIHISIDDFGTGYSSLMLIHNIDADVVKIDKSFVDAIPGDHKSAVLIESIISIAHNLEMELIAEGVETAEQGKALLELGCHNIQGYYYSKPVDFEAAGELIRNPPFKPIA